MKKIVIKKGEEKIMLPKGIYVDGYIININVVQYKKVDANPTNSIKKGE